MYDHVSSLLARRMLLTQMGSAIQPQTNPQTARIEGRLAASLSYGAKLIFVKSTNQDCTGTNPCTRLLIARGLRSCTM